MTSKTSSPTRKNEFRQTFRWALKKNAGMGGLLTALLFAFLPMILLLALTNNDGYRNAGMTEAAWRNSIASQYAQFLRTMIPIAALSLLLLFSVVLCVRLFGYMQNRRSEDLFHALPVGRVPMLLGRWCAGMVTLALPALVNFGILAVIAFAYRIPLSAGSMYLGTALSWLLLMTAAAFTFLTFLSVCSGSVMDTILSALGLNVGYPAVVFLALSMIQRTLPGVVLSNIYNFAVLSLLAPFLAAYLPFIGQVAQEIPAWFLPWWIGATVALLAGSCLLYRRRKSESAEDRFAFPAQKTVIRFLLTACGGMGFGLIGTRAGMGNLAVFLLFAAVGSFLTHCIVEVIYSRGFRGMTKSLRWYGVFAVCFAVFYGVLATGCFGYDSAMPDAAQVESVTMEADSYRSGGNRVYRGRTGSVSMELEPVLKKAENIRTVLAFHRDLIAKYRAETYPYVPRWNSGGSVQLSYRLKDGTTFERSFVYPPAFSSWASEKEMSIEKLEEYRNSSDILFFVSPEDVTGVVLYGSNGGEGVDYRLGDAESALREELMDALRNSYDDLLAASVSGYDNSQFNTLCVTFREPIHPDARLQDVLGGYSGDITTGSPTYYYRKNGEVARVLKKIEALGK